MVGKITVRSTHESHPDACPRCDGFGRVEDAQTCPACGGIGRRDDIVTGDEARRLACWHGQTPHDGDHAGGGPVG